MRVLVFGFFMLLANFAGATVVDEALSNAIRTNQVGRVRMLLQNHPNFQRLNPGNDWSYLWQALFAADAHKTEDRLGFSDTQREIAGMLLQADPGLLVLRTGPDAKTPLTALFQLYSGTIEAYGLEQAKGIEERIRFLVGHGARIEEELYETPTVRLPLHYYVSGLRPEAFELALSLGVSVNSEFNIKTPSLIGPVRLLSYLTFLSIGEGDPVKSEATLQKIEMLLRRGADPRKTHRAPNGARLPIFVGVFLSWDTLLQRQMASGEAADSSRYPKILRLFFEYGLSEYENWGDSYISEWSSQDSSWRRASLRLLMNLVTSGEIAPPPPAPKDRCELKLGEEAQASLK